MKNKSVLCLMACLGYCGISWSQDVLKGTKYTVETGAFVSTAPTNPFWIRSNQYGEVPLEGQVFTIRGSAYKDYDSSARKKKVVFGYGVRGVANFSKNNQLLFSEFYGKARYGAFELYAGRRKELMGLADSTIGSGSYIWSGNALPLPKLQIALVNYTPLLKNGLIAFKGNYAHGWFGSGDSTKNFFLHQKSLYIRVGKPAWRFKVYGGINHQVQWGGRPSVPFLQGRNKALVTHYGSGLQAYIHVVTGISLNQGYYTDDGGISGEGGNRLGNHLGTADIALEYETASTKWFLYRQSIYEDGSLFVLSNISDGLLGLAIDFKKGQKGVKKIVLEFLDTSSQGGELKASNRTAFIPEFRGGDDYFNNSTYEEGWKYRKQTIGTPFIMPLNATTGKVLTDFIGNYKPLYAVHPSLIINNRVKAWIVGVHSKVGRADLVSRVSYSQNLGKYYLYSRVLIAPVQFNQLSLQQQISFPLKKYVVSAVAAYDNSGILEENLGLQVLIKRHF